MVCVYFDAEGRAPPYEIPVEPELENGHFVFRGSLSRDVHMHLQEFAENSVDFAHFPCLHGQMCVPFTNIPIPGMLIKHDAAWEMDTTYRAKNADGTEMPAMDELRDGEVTYPVAYFHDKAYLEFMGKRIPRSDGRARITFVGPGGITYFRFYTEIGDVVLLHTHRPVEVRVLAQLLCVCARSGSLPCDA